MGTTNVILGIDRRRRKPTRARSDVENAGRIPSPSISSAKPIRILIAGELAVLSASARAQLEAEVDFQILARASNAKEAARLAVKLNPDVILLDLVTPSASKLEMVAAINRARPEVRTIAVSDGLQDSDLVELVRLGARGFVSKEYPIDLLGKCIRLVHAGELWISRATVSRMAEILATSGVIGRPDAPRTDIKPSEDFRLSPREREILQLIVDGCSNKVISDQLSVGQDTVKHHLTSMFDKTGTSSRLELALFALDHHLAVR
jgi:two-component system nitrate/nitrite response regulator NarL